MKITFMKKNKLLSYKELKIYSQRVTLINIL